MDQNRWISQDKIPGDRPGNLNILGLTNKFQCSEILIKLLVCRGLYTDDEISSFLNPQMEIVHNAAVLNTLPNISEAVKRLKKAYSKKQKILVYGDYDADGVISTAILFNFLKDAGFNAKYYIPDRFEDGYDINAEFIKKTSTNKEYDLVICVDCGTNAFEVKDFVENTSGIDIIVCDHHEPVNQKKESLIPDYFQDKNSSIKTGNLIANSTGKEINPEAKLNKKNKTENDSISYGPEDKYGRYIIINPKLEQSGYPYKFLSGAGVTFKFIIASLRSFEKQVRDLFSKEYLKDMLDLVAISTVSDVMPLTGENRAIVKAGLELLKNTKHRGLEKIINEAFNEKTSGKKEKFTTYDIGFVISPRLNASGRLKNAKDSAELLIKGSKENSAESDIKLDRIVKELENYNKKRRDIQQELFNNIIKSYDFEDIIKNKKIFIESSPKWHEGVLGIVASSIVKKFNIPAILFKENSGLLKGSGRSTQDFDLYENLSNYKKYFIKFGGHRMACGITMEKKQFDIFKSEITGPKNLLLKNLDTSRKYHYDLKIKFTDISHKVLKDIDRMEPFGVGNPKPLFLTENCEIISKSESSGTKKHLFFKLKNDGKFLKAVFFNYSDTQQHLRIDELKNNKIDILFNTNATEAGDIQLILKSLRPSQ